MFVDEDVSPPPKKTEDDEGSGDRLSYGEKELRNIVRRLGLKEKELHDVFIINEEKLIALMTDTERQILHAGDLVIFKDKADDIIGIELDSFIKYLIDSTP